MLLPNSPPAPALYNYAQTLGIISASLTFFQYAPQISTTYRAGVVGALSIPMMLLQVPGSAMFVGSLIGRPGVEWSAWLSYAFAGTMQGVLLVSQRLVVCSAVSRSNRLKPFDSQFMCLIFRARQRKLGQDDFGNPLAITLEQEDDIED